MRPTGSVLSRLEGETGSRVIVAEERKILLGRRWRLLAELYGASSGGGDLIVLEEDLRPSRHRQAQKEIVVSED